MIRTATNLSATALFAAALVGAASAEESIAYQNLVTPVLSSGTTVIDQPIAYPAGTANVTAVIVTIPPGGDTGWHVHAVPLFAYVLEGAVTVDYGEKGIKVIKAGDAILDASRVLVARTAAGRGLVFHRALSFQACRALRGGFAGPGRLHARDPCPRCGGQRDQRDFDQLHVDQGPAAGVPALRGAHPIADAEAVERAGL